MRLKFTITIFISMFVVFLFQATAQTSHDVSVTSNVFTPSDLTISVGDTIVWTNNEGFHNVNGTTSAYPDNPESFGNNTGTGWVYSYVFTTSGTYNYHCDPHQGLGMKGKITVEETGTAEPFAINFSGMTPHVGQDLWLAVKEQDTGNEIVREHVVVEESFSILVEEIEAGKSYVIDFYADHNGNRKYDAPSTDHAWRLEIADAEESGSLDFVHNTDFTDIEWMHKLTVDFVSMTPHIGQALTLFLIEQPSNNYVDTLYLEEIPGEAFSLSSTAIISNQGYHLDFYADHNQNSSYDAPPTDHAWRVTINDLVGDTTVIFTHNTDFTDIFQETTSFRNKNLEGLLLHPNPANNYLNITSNTNAPVHKVHIYSITGKRIESIHIEDVKQVNLDISHLEPGMYLLQVMFGNKTQTLRIMKK